MAQETGQVKQSQVLRYLREKNPSMQSVGDSTLVSYLKERKPDLYARYIEEQQSGQPQQPQQPRPGIQVAGENVNRAMGAWQQPFQQAQQDIQSGNPLAGVLRSIAGAAQLPFAPIGAAAEGYRNLPVAIGGDTPAMRTIGGVLASPFDVLSAIPSLAGQAVDIAGRGLDAILPSNESIATGVQGRRLAETSSALGDVTRTAAGYAAPFVVPKIARGIQESAKSAQIKHQTQTGASVGAGESIEGMRRAGSFAAEHNIPIAKTTQKSGEMVPVGAERAKQLASQYHSEVDALISDATQRGDVIKANDVLKPLQKMRDEYLNDPTPKRAAVHTIDALIRSTRERLTREGGTITPEVAQELKVRGNDVLKRFYEQVERRGGTLTPLEKVEQQGMSRVVGELRSQLETLDPAIKELNWSTGAGIELAEAIERFAKAKLTKDPAWVRGSGITGAAAGRSSAGTLYAITELALYRPFRYAYHKAMSKIAGKIAGTPPEFPLPAPRSSTAVRP